MTIATVKFTKHEDSKILNNIGKLSEPSMEEREKFFESKSRYRKIYDNIEHKEHKNIGFKQSQPNQIALRNDKKHNKWRPIEPSTTPYQVKHSLKEIKRISTLNKKNNFSNSKNMIEITDEFEKFNELANFLRNKDIKSEGDAEKLIMIKNLLDFCELIKEGEKTNQEQNLITENEYLNKYSCVELEKHLIDLLDNQRYHGYDNNNSEVVFVPLLERIRKVLDQPKLYYENLKISKELSFSMYLTVVCQSNKKQIMETYDILYDELKTGRHLLFSKCFKMEKIISETYIPVILISYDIKNLTYEVSYQKTTYKFKYFDNDFNVHELPSIGFQVLKDNYDQAIVESYDGIMMFETYEVQETKKGLFNKRREKIILLISRLAEQWDRSFFYTCKLLKLIIPGLIYSKEYGYTSIFRTGHEHINQEQIKSGRIERDSEVEIIKNMEKLLIVGGIAKPFDDIQLISVFNEQLVSKRLLNKTLMLLPYKIACMDTMNFPVREIELLIKEQVDGGQLSYEFYDLFSSLHYPEATTVFPYKNSEGFSKIDINKFNHDKKYDEYCINEKTYNNRAFYKIFELKKERENDVKKEFTDEQKRDYLHRKGTLLIDKINNRIRLTGTELKTLSGCYSYVNEKAYNVSNFKILNKINMIMNDASLIKYTKLLKIRLGCTAVTLLSQFLYIEQITLRDSTLIDFYKLPFLTLKHSYWISFWKQLSDSVKVTYTLGKNVLVFTEWRHLQYIEMFFGQFGGDEVSAFDTVKRRIYGHIPKVLYKRINGKLSDMNEDQKDKIVYKLLVKYWDKVIRARLRKGNLSNIEQSFNNRAKWATSSSGGGGRSAFTKDVIKDSYGMKVSSITKNKNAVINSEDILFFLNTVTDLPITLSNMTLKPKEFSKKRYIYGVSIQHYLINSFVQADFDKYLDHYGVKVNQDNLKSFGDMQTNQNTNVFNCVDYSEFNDQHEEELKSNIWLSCSESIMKTNQSCKGDYKFACKWLSAASYCIWLKIPSCKNNIYRHKGRLLSGERATSLINSIASMVYLWMGLWNDLIFRTNPGNEIMMKMEKHPGDIHEFIEILKMNEILGDDNRLKMECIYDAVVLNETLFATGCVLKAEKCMIGYNVSEFLRYVTITNTTDNEHNGYAARSIISLVSGNLEGSTERFFISQIAENESLLQKIYARTGQSGVLDEVLEQIKNSLSRKVLTQDGKTTVTTQPLPTKWMYIPKKNGGMGFVTFKTNETVETNLKLNIPKKLKERVFVDILKTKGICQALKTSEINNVLAILGDKGKINSKKFGKKINAQIQDLLISQVKFQDYMTEEWLLTYNKTVNFLIEQCIPMKYITYNSYYKEKIDQSKLTKDFRDLVWNELRSQYFIGAKNTQTKTRIESLTRAWEVCDTGVTIAQFLQRKLSKSDYCYYLVTEDYNPPNHLSDMFDVGQWRNLLAGLIYRLKNYKDLYEIAYLATLYFKQNGLIATKE